MTLTLTRFTACLAAACLFPAALAQAQLLTAITEVRLIDGTGAGPLEDAVMLIRDGRIQAVGPADQIEIPDDAERVSMAGKTLVPGMVNAHGHAGEDTLRKLRVSAAYGVTTVLSLGGEDASHRALVEAQDAPGLDRARLYMAGPVITAGTPEAAVAQVNQVADMGADWVKFRIEGGNVPEPVYTAIIEQSRERGLPVAAHMYHLDDSKALLRQGVEMLAHSVRDQRVDDEFLRLMAEADACYSPTLMREVSTYVYESRPDFFDDPFFLTHAPREEIESLLTERVRQRNQASVARGKADLAQAIENLGLIHAAGLPIAMGTDSGAFVGRFIGYFEHMELDLMAEAGMSPMDIIASSTGVAARCARLDDELGTLTPGKWADFIVLDSNPLEDIRHLRQIDSVWVAGEAL